MPRRAGRRAAAAALGLGEEATIFHIETVLKRRKKKNKVEYLIRWSGFDAAHNSWEPRVQLVADGNGPLLEEFDEGEASKKRKRKGSSSAAPPQAAKSSEVSPPQSRSKRTRAGSVEAQPPLSAQQLKPKRSTRNSPASPKPASARQIAQQKQQKLKAASGGHTAVTLSSRSPRPPASTGGWSTAPVSGATAQQLSSAAAAPVSRLSLDDAQDASGLGSHAASASALVGSASSAAPAVAVAPAAPVGGGHAVANARRSCMSMRTRCTSLFDEVIERSGDSIDRAAAVILRAVETDSLVHIFGGDGHSQLAAMELVRRPGALANFSSIFGPGLGLWERSTNLEGVSGIGQLTLAAHHVRSEDVVIVCSLHGLNAAAVDTAVASRERGCTVIALTCARHSSHMRSWSRTFGSKPGQQGGAQGRGGRSSSGKPSSKCEAEWSQATGRHPSRRSLSDCADILIDTNTADTNATGASAESGSGSGSASGSGSGSAFASETGIVVGGIGVGSLATIVSCFTMQLLNLRVCELAAMRMPPVPVKLWRSKLAPGGIEHNESIERHFSRVGAQRQALT